MFIDFHAHFLPKRYLDQLVHTVRGAEIGRDASGRSFFSIRGVSGDLPERLVDAEVRIKWMKKFKIDHEVLGLSPMGEAPKKEQRLVLARTFNDELSSVARKYPDRFSALATLPSSAISDVLEELERCISSLDIKGVALSSSFVEFSLEDPKFSALYAKLASKEIPIFLHPSALRGDGSPLSILINTTVNLTARTTTAVLRMAATGIFERYPKLRVVAAHVGGTFPYLVERIDRARNGFVHDALQSLPRPLSEYMKLVYVDTAAASRQALICAYEFLGTRKLVLGTDSPYSDRWGPASDITSTINGLDISEEEKRGILGDTAGRLLGLERD